MSFDVHLDQGVTLPDVLKNEQVSVDVADEKLRLSLRVKSADRASIGKAIGVGLPPKIGTSKTSKGLMSICLGPEEWLLIGDMATHAGLYDICLQLSEDYVMSVAEVSHRNVCLRLNGPGAAEMVNVGCPLDMSLDMFPVGKCVRTVYENAPILLIRLSETRFELECWRSFAPYVVGLMAAHARAHVNAA